MVFLIFIFLFFDSYLSPGQEQQRIFKANYSIDRERNAQNVSLSI